jgi:hypothetical protein
MNTQGGVKRRSWPERRKWGVSQVELKREGTAYDSSEIMPRDPISRGRIKRWKRLEQVDAEWEVPLFAEGR